MRRIIRIVRRIVVGAVLLAVALFVLLGVVAHLVVPEIPPTPVDAPWLVQTSSLIYYAREYTIIDEVPHIRGFWTLDARGKRYTYHATEKPFPPELYGKVAVVRRARQ